MLHEFSYRFTYTIIRFRRFYITIKRQRRKYYNKIKKEIQENCLTYGRFVQDVYIGIEKATNSSQDDLMRKLSELSLDNLKTENIQKID